MSLTCHELLQKTPRQSAASSMRPAMEPEYLGEANQPEEEVRRLLDRENDVELEHNRENLGVVYANRDGDPGREEIVNALLFYSNALGFHEATVALAVQVMDRFLSQHPVPFEYLSRVSACCLLIASKHREQEHANVIDIARIACCEVRDVAALELFVLEKVQWRLETGTAHDFAVLAKAMIYPAILPRGFSEQLKFFLDVSLTVVDFHGVAPSIIAASAIVCCLEANVKYMDSQSTRRTLLELVATLCRGRSEELRFSACVLSREWQAYKSLSASQPQSPCTVVYEFDDAELTPLDVSAVENGKECAPEVVPGETVEFSLCCEEE